MTRIEDLSGDDGELIERLVGLVNIDDRWDNLAWFLVFAIGGRRLDKIVPDTGVEPVPGSVGEVHRRTHELVSRADYFVSIKSRLTELVGSGLREDVLVRALRDEMTTRLRDYTEVDAANQRREETRLNLIRWADDPDKVARFRDGLAERDPEAALLSDEEVAARLREMSESLTPIPVEQELRAWADHDQWIASIDTALSDEVIDKWLGLNSRKAL